MAVPAPVYCEAVFNYVGAAGPVSVELPVLDGRRVATDFEGAGFTLLEHRSALASWQDQHALDTVHADEVAPLAQAFTRCDVALVYPAIVRSPATAAAVADYKPIELVHSDFTEDYRRMVTEPDRPYRVFLQPLLERHNLTQADLAKAERLLMLQLWRNTGPALPDRPLAFCDARTVARHRRRPFVVPEYGGRRLEFETFGFAPPGAGDADRWCTFPALQPHEVVAFRTYDSACEEAGRPFWTPHSAFRDPHVPEGEEHRRSSVEMRALCVWR